MDLTTLARVKIHLKGGKLTVGGDAEELVSALITMYSPAFERHLDRLVLAGSQQEYFSVEPGQRRFALHAYPVTAVTSVYHDTSREWTTGEVSSDSYYLDTSTGMLTIDGYGLFPGAGVLRVIYAGGMAADTAAFIAAFPEIASACDMQVAYHYGRARKLGSTVLSGKDGSVTHDGPLKLLPTVESAIAGHRRVIVG